MGLFNRKQSKPVPPAETPVRVVNERIDADLAAMEKQSAEMGLRRAALRNRCPLSNHDRCHSH